jgi:hypothetical protein
MCEPGKQSKISAHAIGALYMSIAALILPIIVMSFVRSNPAAEIYLDRLHHGDTKLMALLSFFSIILTVASIRWGKTARKRIRASDGDLKGKGRAWAGLVLGCVGLVLYLPVLLITFPFTPFAPNVDGSAIAAHQASAVGSLRMVHAQAEMYRATYHRGYPRHLSALGPLREGDTANAAGAGLIDEKLASGSRSGYTFIYQVTARDENHLPSAYSITAIPLAGCGKGENCYYTDETGVVRMETDRLPNQHSYPLAY